MEESTDGMVPNISDYNSQFQNVATQTDLTDHEAYLTEVIDNNNKRTASWNRKLRNLRVNYKILVGRMIPLIRDCLLLKT